jgi:hypothetical protein
LLRAPPPPCPAADITLSRFVRRQQKNAANAPNAQKTPPQISPTVALGSGFDAASYIMYDPDASIATATTAHIGRNSCIIWPFSELTMALNLDKSRG